MTQLETRRRRRPLLRILNLLSSVRLGITLVALIVIYGAVGSAWPAFRQAFELSEFQFFNHWLFSALTLLLCLTVTVATVRRIPVNARNIGVLTVHAGVLILCAGSFVYFGQRIEGDVFLNAPSVRIVHLDAAPGGRIIGEIVAVENEVWQANAPALGGHHHIEITQVHHDGMTTAAHVTLLANVADQPQRTIELSQTAPGRPGPAYAQLSDQLGVVLVPAIETDTFYDNTTPTLLVSRGAGDDARAPRYFELPDLPFYNERFVATDDAIHDTQGKPVQSERIAPLPMIEHWRMPIPILEADSAAAKDWGLTLEIDAYLPYAELNAGPVVIPLNRRRSLADVRRQKSLVRLHAQTLDGSWSRRVWVPFSHYNAAGDGTAPTHLHDVPGIDELSFIYGRATRPLPAAMRLESLQTTYYPGRNQPDSWTSLFRYHDPEPDEVLRPQPFLNHILTLGHWPLLQPGAPAHGCAHTGG